MRVKQERERRQRKVHKISIVNGVIVTEEDKNKIWVPIKEALPNKDGYYLVTIEGTKAIYVDIAMYCNNTFIVNDEEAVTAWQEMPKEYRG